MSVRKTPEELEERRQKRLAYHREWARNNRDKRNSYRDKWMEKHPEKAREYEVQYRQNHRDLYNQSARRYYAKNIEKCRARQTEYRNKYADRVAESQRTYTFGKAGNAYYHQQLNEQNGLCAICGKDGTHTPKSLGLDHDHRFDAKDPRGWRGVLCMYCNAGLGNFMEDISLLGGAARDYLLYWSSPRELEKAS